jgi:hypothetical protein
MISNIEFFKFTAFLFLSRKFHFKFTQLEVKTIFNKRNETENTYSTLQGLNPSSNFVKKSFRFTVSLVLSQKNKKGLYTCLAVINSMLVWFINIK